MKTISKISKVLLMALTFVFTTTIANAQERVMVHMGLRLPQMNTEERSKIGAEAHKQHARGQMIFNTDTETLEYWSGERWVEVNASDSVLQYIINNVTQELTDSIMARVNIKSADNSVTITGSGTSTIDLSVNIDEIVQDLIDNSTFVQNMIINIAGDTTFVDLLINNNYFIEELITNITKNEQFVTNILDSVMANVSVVGERGLIVTRNGTRNITVSLPEGQAEGQILTWDNTLEVWKVTAPAPIVRQLTVDVLNGEFTTENLIFHGKTSASTNTLQILGVEPIFADAQLRRMFLKVSATVENVGNAAEWTVSVENRNFSPDNTFVLSSVIISYITADVAPLTGGDQELIQIAGF